MSAARYALCMRSLVAALVGLVFASVALAQAEAPTPAELAHWTQAYLVDAPTLDARFQQDAWSPVYRRTTTSHGRLRTAPPAHVRIDYDDHGPIVVADGADYLWVQPSDDRWPAQYARGTQDAVSAAFAVLAPGAALDRDYAISACAHLSASAPEHTGCLELVPRGRSAFDRLRLYVRTDAEHRGEPARLSVGAHDGTWNTFTFRELTRGASHDARLFDLTPPAGAREMPHPS